MELEQIIDKVFPYRSCPQDRAADNQRKKWLLIKVTEYINTNFERKNIEQSVEDKSNQRVRSESF